MINENPKSTGEMMSAIMTNVGNLVRNEADLARAEVAESFKKAGASVAAMGVAFVLAITGLNVAAASLVAFAIWAGVPPHWAPAVVGVGFLVIALIVFATAKSKLHQIGFVPTRTARNVQRDAAAIKETFHDK
ncbi:MULTISPECIES: phage holin family protein [unclassified Yoonia]|uniref:phage holin family protein n=1 Tax=unclassified Yoonia TaxID=2629118 RepID=UPI002B0001D8|nr:MULTISPECIES: phage holin family protein [unclassified Yoonia]